MVKRPQYNTFIEFYEDNKTRLKCICQSANKNCLSHVYLLLSTFNVGNMTHLLKAQMI